MAIDILHSITLARLCRLITDVPKDTKPLFHSARSNTRCCGTWWLTRKGLPHIVWTFYSLYLRLNLSSRSIWLLWKALEALHPTREFTRECARFITSFQWATISTATFLFNRGRWTVTAICYSSVSKSTFLMVGLFLHTFFKNGNPQLILGDSASNSFFHLPTNSCTGYNLVNFGSVNFSDYDTSYFDYFGVKVAANLFIRTICD